MAMTLSSALQANADDVTFTSSNLPIVIIQTDQAINAETKVRGTMKIICNGEGEINHISDAANDYDGYIGIKWRGESSLNFNQKKYTIETRDALDNDTAVSLLGMPEEADWVLLAPYNDVSMVRDVFAQRFPDKPVVIVHAPVCRPGWLVEMECTAVKAISNPNHPQF